jgi:hypothetical protein
MLFFDSRTMSEIQGLIPCWFYENIQQTEFVNIKEYSWMGYEMKADHHIQLLVVGNSSNKRNHIWLLFSVRRKSFKQWLILLSFPREIVLSVWRIITICHMSFYQLEPYTCKQYTAAEDCVVPLSLWSTEEPASCNMVLSSHRNDGRWAWLHNDETRCTYFPRSIWIWRHTLTIQWKEDVLGIWN